MKRREFIEYRDEMSDNHYGATGFTLGIIGLFAITPSLICGILAIVFGAVQIKKEKTPIATAGIVLGITDIVLWRVIPVIVLMLIFL